jgi:anti-sigma B factor antagonist
MGAKLAKEVLTLGGIEELTAANANLFRKKFCSDLNGYATIEIDLSGTTFMDCTGLGALVALRNMARARKDGLRLVNPTPPVQRLFDAVRAGEIFEIVNTRPTDHPRFASDPVFLPSSLSIF